MQALLERARIPTWRLWARESAIETKDLLKARGYAWSPGEFGRPRCWYRDVSDAGKAAEVSWLRANVMESDQAVWALRITARDRYSDRCWGWGEPLAEPAVQNLEPTFPGRPRAHHPEPLIPSEDAIGRFCVDSEDCGRRDVAPKCFPGSPGARWDGMLGCTDLLRRLERDARVLAP